jgi:hypothetical protein
MEKLHYKIDWEKKYLILYNEDKTLHSVNNLEKFALQGVVGFLGEEYELEEARLCMDCGCHVDICVCDDGMDDIKEV